MTKIEKDSLSGTDLTGHEWDGIRELNTPLPRWWVWTFYITIVWAVGYAIAYPAIPLCTDATKGVLGWSSRALLAEEIAAVEAGRKGIIERIAKSSVAEIRDDAELNQFALAGGRSAFAVNCSQCHGSGAQGAKGFPNLNDDDWLWGGSLEAIQTSITVGIRSSDNDETRDSDMPAFGTDEILSKAEITDVANFVRSLSGLENDAGAAGRGAVIYADNCAACHGADGGGDRELGAPALNDAIWLYGSDLATIVETVDKSRRGVMPAWGRRLDTATIKELAVYVHALGGGE